MQSLLYIERQYSRTFWKFSMDFSLSFLRQNARIISFFLHYASRKLIKKNFTFKAFKTTVLGALFFKLYNLFILQQDCSLQPEGSSSHVYPCPLRDFIFMATLVLVFCLLFSHLWLWYLHSAHLSFEEITINNYSY